MQPQPGHRSLYGVAATRPAHTRSKQGGRRAATLNRDTLASGLEAPRHVRSKPMGSPFAGAGLSPHGMEAQARSPAPGGFLRLPGGWPAAAIAREPTNLLQVAPACEPPNPHRRPAKPSHQFRQPPVGAGPSAALLDPKHVEHDLGSNALDSVVAGLAAEPRELQDSDRRIGRGRATRRRADRGPWAAA